MYKSCDSKRLHCMLAATANSPFTWHDIIVFIFL